MALDALGRYQEALAAWDQTVEVAGQKQPEKKLGRAKTLLHLGQFAAAAAIAQEVSAQHPAPNTAYTAACVYAICAEAAGKDDHLQPAERTQLEENYASDALRLLRDAIARGYHDVDQLKIDLDLAALRPREDFQQLMRDLEAKSAKDDGE